MGPAVSTFPGVRDGVDQEKTVSPPVRRQWGGGLWDVTAVTEVLVQVVWGSPG